MLCRLVFVSLSSSRDNIAAAARCPPPAFVAASAMTSPSLWSPQPPPHCRTSNPNIQGAFYFSVSRVADGFPINQWDKLLPQTILTLNLLRQSNVAPNISAWAYHHGSFDYNRMPLAPMGCAVQFLLRPSRRKTFGEHAEDGFYLKTSEEHYRTHVVFCTKTQAKRLADTVFFKHKYITQPTVTPADAMVIAVAVV